MKLPVAAPLLVIFALLVVLMALASCDGVHDASVAGNLVPPTVDEDPTIPAVEFAGSRFHFQSLGAPGNPTIILLHGGPGSDSREMLRLTERQDGYALTDDYQVVIWDQRGTGLSRRHGCGVYTIDRAEADLDALVDLVSPGRPVILVGHSWGGMYATLYINHHPDKVAAAALMEAGPLNGAMFDSIAPDLYDLDVFSKWLNDDVWSTRFLTPDDHARADFALMIGMRDGQPKFHLQEDHDPAPVWRLGAVTHHCLMAAGMKDGKPAYDFSDHLAAFTKPVLFVASELNEVIGVAFQERQRAFYPSTTLVTIAGSGHDFPWTHPAETLAAIHAYLGTVN